MNEWRPSGLFLQSEFIFWEEFSRVEDIGDAHVITTPSNPAWRWGHVLVLHGPPQAEGVAHWREIHATCIGPHQLTPHRMLLWDGPALDPSTLQAYEADGWKFRSMDVLTLRELEQPNFYNSEIEVLQLDDSDSDWDAVLALDVACFGAEANNPNYHIFASRRNKQYKEMVAKGGGHWYGAFLAGELVGSLGIFEGDGLLRYQEIAVIPAHQRKGIASTLIYESALVGLEEFPNHTQVIVTDKDNSSIRVYRSLGFETESYSYSLSGSV